MAQAIVDGIDSTSNFQIANQRRDVDAELLFFSTIDEATKVWLNTLHCMWGLSKKCAGVSRTLTDYFETAPNPYLSTLRILVNTTDFHRVKTKSSLAFTVMEEFSKWLEIHRDTYKECLVPDLKIAAFKLVNKQTNMQLVNLVSITYDFVGHKKLFLQLIEAMVEEKKYKEAAQYATLLQLQDHFSNPEVLLLPLMLQSKLSIVEAFLCDCPEIQKNLVMYLDDLIASWKNMQVTLDNFIEKHNISEVRMSTTQVKPMTKTIARFVKLYNLPPEVCPNLIKKRSKGALQFLIHKRYMEGTLSTESWREMAREAVGIDPNLQLELIEMLIYVNDAQEGLYWAKAFNIPESQWPWQITYVASQAAENVNDGASTSTAEDWGTDTVTENCHKLRLPRHCIKVVDNPRSFEDFLNNGLKSAIRVGIDSEWKPSFGTKQTELALIQIATDTNVYILDLTTMGNDLTELWSELHLTLFENKNILKLGFGIAHDMTVIRDSLPAFAKIKTHGQGYIDIVHLWDKLIEDYKFVFPYEGDSGFKSKSLSKLVELCLGQKLNKSDQFSNWEQRPLRESQIMYAALDAYCLLEVYDALATQCMHMDIPFYDICAEIQRISHKSPKRSVKKSISKRSTNCQPEYYEKADSYKDQRSLQSYSYSPRDGAHKQGHPKPQEYQRKPRALQYSTACAVIPAHKWRVVCDSMLGGLASKLRMCGCDCIHVLFDQGGHQSATIAMHENRVLLTRNRGYQRLLQYLPYKKCYRVMADTSENQLREVLDHFSVLVTEKDIFSRCQICNYDEFVKVPRNVMDDLLKSFIKVTRKNSYHRQAHPTNNASQFSCLNNCNVAREELQEDCSAVNCYTNNENRTWCLSTNSLDIATCTTKYQTRVQIDKVPFNVLQNVAVFYICEHCGKVYWDGTHLEHTLNGVIKDLIVKCDL